MNSSDPDVKTEEEEEVPVNPELSEETPAAEVDPETDEQDPYAALEQDVLKWKELAMRTAADLENFRKRAAREREESVRYANQSLLEELLPILDNFEMGMQAAAQEKDSMVFVGMDMVRKQLNEFLSGSGVTEVPAEGLEFDPNLHEAVSQEESSEVEEGKVIRVVRRGYTLRDRLLRPASVVVSKSPEAKPD
ncbi:nucleotide exchange factor GrpE [Haloferula helveola]|uniref:Protein GrpE n=1 Tax=Haloferula helveola TaxID=490095 RepID=A0ABM7REE2_9BACT|nr:nucleotide exchange factor GrpE [Haloferula helveola]